MATPLKSPEHKRAKGDLGEDSGADDEHFFRDSKNSSERKRTHGEPDDGKSQQLTLDALSNLLDRKFDERLIPVTDMLNALRADLGTFKAKIREEIESMGLQLKTTESTLSNTCTRIEKLEQELHALKLQSKHTQLRPTRVQKS